MNGIDYVARILKQEGVEWMACFPSNPLISAVAREGIRPIAFRHERGAVMAADGYSRISERRRFGVVAVQAQAGAENAMGGLAQAYADNSPILVFAGGVNLDQIAVRPNFTAIEKYRGWAKHIEAIFAPEQISAVMRRAFHALRNGPPGPVVVELMADACARAVPAEAQCYRAPTLMRSAPEQGAVEAAADALLAAQRPLIWAGGGALFAGAATALRTLAELTATPVFCTMPGKSVFDERHPLALGAGSGATTLAAHRWLESADVLLALGSSLTRSPYGQPVRPGKTLIHNTLDPADINKEETAAIGLIGDARLTADALVDAIKARGGGATTDARHRVETEIAALKAEWMANWAPLLTSDETPINYYRVINEISRTLDLDNAIVTHDAGAPRDCLVPFFPATRPHSYIGWGKTTHLGFGIPLMIGAKLAAPDKFCLNLMGDGAFGMSGLDIETAVRAEVPITTVVLNNGAMATYSGDLQGIVGPEARERYGVSTMHGNYAKIAEGLGAVGLYITAPSDIAPALQEAQRRNADGETVLIDVHANIEPRRSTF